MRKLRETLRMTKTQFAKLFNVNIQTVMRWETGKSKPSGTALALLNGFNEKFNTDPLSRSDVIQFVIEVNEVGGLPYVIMRLLDLITAVPFDGSNGIKVKPPECNRI